MIIEVNIPNIGEDELEVTEIMVQVGDNININQSLIVIEGDKSSMEIPAPSTGIVAKIHLRIGDKVHSGSLILSLNTQHSASSIPKNNQTIITQDNNIVSDNIININNINQNNNKYNDHVKPDESNHLVHATPLIRHMARKFGIDLSKISGSGRKGRILKEDIETYINNLTAQDAHPIENIAPSQQKLFALPNNPKINFKKFGDTVTIALNKIQKISGFNLQKNWTTLPHVTQFDIVDVTILENFRKQQNLIITSQKTNFKITLLVFIMKAVAKGLEEFPRFNSSLSQDGNSLILKKYVNIGIAVDTPQGVLVPVIRNVNKKNIITLSQELSEIVKKARSSNQLTPNDMQGGSFTISNLGGIGGGTTFTPIINAPEVAILGISKASIQPMWNGKKFMPRLMLPLSLSYDHRVIDGADGARFITRLNKIISDIRLLSM